MLKGKNSIEYFSLLNNILFYRRFIKPGCFTNLSHLPKTISCCKQYEEKPKEWWMKIVSFWTKYGLQTRNLMINDSDHFEIVTPDNSVIETEQLL